MIAGVFLSRSFRYFLAVALFGLIPRFLIARRSRERVQGEVL